MFTLFQEELMLDHTMSRFVESTKGFCDQKIGRSTRFCFKILLSNVLSSGGSNDKPISRGHAASAMLMLMPVRMHKMWWAYASICVTRIFMQRFQHVISLIHLKAVMHSVLKMHEWAMHMLHDSVLLHYDYHCDLWACILMCPTLPIFLTLNHCNLRASILVWPI